MRQNSVTFQSSPNRVPNQVKEPLGGATTTERKIEEQVKLPLVSSHPQQVVRPRASQQQCTRMQRPKKSQINDQKYFPRGPQVIRTPVHILKTEVFSPPRSAREKRTTSESPIQELAKLQEIQEKSSSPEVSRDISSVQEKLLGEVKPIIGNETSQKKELPVVQVDKSDETVSSDNLDLEEVMEGIQESTASSTESTKSGWRLKYLQKFSKQEFLRSACKAEFITTGFRLPSNAHEKSVPWNQHTS